MNLRMRQNRVTFPPGTDHQKLAQKPGDFDEAFAEIMHGCTRMLKFRHAGHRRRTAEDARQG
jgi:hypothetical protein